MAVVSNGIGIHSIKAQGKHPIHKVHVLYDYVTCKYLVRLDMVFDAYFEAKIDHPFKGSGGGEEIQHLFLTSSFLHTFEMLAHFKATTKLGSMYRPLAAFVGGSRNGQWGEVTSDVLNVEVVGLPGLDVFMEKAEECVQVHHSIYRLEEFRVNKTGLNGKVVSMPVYMHESVPKSEYTSMITEVMIEFPEVLCIPEYYNVWSAIYEC